MKTASDAFRALTDAATRFVEYSAKTSGAMQRAALRRAEYYYDAAALVADACDVEHNREALDALRGMVTKANLP